MTFLSVGESVLGIPGLLSLMVILIRDPSSDSES